MAVSFNVSIQQSPKDSRTYLCDRQDGMGSDKDPFGGVPAAKAHACDWTLACSAVGGADNALPKRMPNRSVGGAIPTETVLPESELRAFVRWRMEGGRLPLMRSDQ